MTSASGSTLRIAWKKATPTRYGMYFKCRTPLVETLRTLFPNDFAFEGNRAIVFEESGTVPVDARSLGVAASLTYHRDRARTTRPPP